MSLSQVTATSVIGQEERKDPGTVVRDDRQTRYCGVVMWFLTYGDGALGGGGIEEAVH